MSSKRSQRLAFAVFVAVALCIIGRNLYKRYMNAQLFRAIASHDVDEARSLLNRGADVNATQDTTPALLEAMSQLTPPSMILTLSIPGQVLTPPSQDIPADAEAVACLLIERHADLRMPRISVAVGEQPKVSGYDDAGYVEEACRHGSIPVLRCLLNRGVALTPRCLDAALQYVSLASSGSTTFSGSGTAQVESAAAKAEKAKQALRLAQQKEVIRQMAQLLREHGLRPTLAQCVELNDVTALKAALDAGISPEPQSSNTEPTLITAVRKGNLEMVTLLLAHGADANSHTGYGDSALNVAVAQGNLEVVKLLLAHGADVKGGKTSTALEHAMWGKHLAIARLLLAKGADPNFTFGSAAYSALPEAILSLPEIVPELLQHGVNLNAGNGAVLRAALRTRRIALVQELLRRGVNVNPLPPPATPTTAAGGSLAAPSATTPAQGITDAPDPNSSRTKDSAAVFAPAERHVLCPRSRTPAAESGREHRHGQNHRSGGIGKMRTGRLVRPNAGIGSRCQRRGWRWGNRFDAGGEVGPGRRFRFAGAWREPQFRNQNPARASRPCRKRGKRGLRAPAAGAWRKHKFMPATRPYSPVLGAQAQRGSCGTGGG